MPRAYTTDAALAAVADGVRLTVRLTPRGRADRIEGIAVQADDSRVLRVSVTAPPEDGRANEALLRLLAKQWRLARRDLAIVGGARSRNKLVHIAGDSTRLLAQLNDAIARLPKS